MKIRQGERHEGAGGNLKADHMSGRTYLSWGQGTSQTERDSGGQDEVLRDIEVNHIYNCNYVWGGTASLGMGKTR